MQTLTLGEVLWDIIEEKPYLGGAPLNVAAHLAKMGAESYLISSLGKDELGEKALEKIRQIGLKPDYIFIDPHRPTGTVDVFLHQGQPDYTIHQGVAWDHLQLTDTQKAEIYAKNWDFVIIGVLAQRTENNQAFYHELFKNIQAKEIFLDINLRKSFYSKAVLEESFRKAGILKLNDEEVPIVADLFYHQAMDFDTFAARMIRDFDVRTVCLTLGKNGAKIYTETDSLHVPAPKIQVADTIGAGDSFSAAFIYTLHRYGDVKLAAEKACTLGAFVASHAGALPEYSKEILELLK
ncbi:MAG: carbohydrate kinase [Microscillaceae bacterium]|nr:carbohydrate kinase [Microscillaceae bacterium]